MMHTMYVNLDSSYVGEASEIFNQCIRFDMWETHGMFIMNKSTKSV